MNRSLTFLFGPESMLAVFTALVFVFCARHSSYRDEDVRLLEKLIWLLPLIAVPIAFATIYVPGARTWSWLARANVALVVSLAICAVRVVSGFGAPGSGPKGQDAGLILIVSLGIGFSAIANAITGAMILRAQRPAIAEWFHEHAVTATLLTALSTVPIFVAEVIGVGAVAAVFGFALAVFKS
jgi:hypothetical protein